MGTERGKEGQAAGFLITIDTYNFVVHRDETAILYAYIYTYRNFLIYEFKFLFISSSNISCHDAIENGYVKSCLCPTCKMWIVTKGFRDFRIGRLFI